MNIDGESAILKDADDNDDALNRLGLRLARCRLAASFAYGPVVFFLQRIRKKRDRQTGRTDQRRATDRPTDRPTERAFADEASWRRRDRPLLADVVQTSPKENGWRSLRCARLGHAGAL